jgi:hypothetical protein
MDDYRWIYMNFVETIAAFATQTIEQNGVLSTATLSNEISKIVAEQPEVCVALWARGLMVRDGLDVFEGAPLEDVELAYKLAMENNTDKNYDITIAGIRATCDGFRHLQDYSAPFHQVPVGHSYSG